MSRVLIIGYGNPLRGDDGIGWHAAERLRGLVQDPEVEVLRLHQLTPELMEPLSRAAFAVFIDASAEGEPGAVVERRILARAGGPASFTHHSTPEALLAGARELYGNAAEAVMITVTGGDFSLSAELSPLVERRLDEVVTAVLRRAAAREEGGASFRG